MPTIVYQGLQSCFESQLIETTTLKLRVAAPSDMELSRGGLKYKKSANLEMGSGGGWAFLQSLSNLSSPPTPKEENEKQGMYVHPLCKTSPRLSQKSLELCTENLGSETGSDTMEISILSLDSSSNYQEEAGKSSSSSQEQRLPRAMESRTKVVSRDFPPPLTSIRSSKSLQVRPHREDGRLIIEAIETPSRNTYLQAERSNGRLRLSYFTDPEPPYEDDNNDDADEAAMNGYEHEYEDKDSNCQEDEEQVDVQEEEDEEEDEEVKGVDSELKFQRPSRCKEGRHGNKGLCDWKPLWVATS